MSGKADACAAGVDFGVPSGRAIGTRTSTARKPKES